MGFVERARARRTAGARAARFREFNKIVKSVDMYAQKPAKVPEHSVETRKYPREGGAGSAAPSGAQNPPDVGAKVRGT